MSTTATAIRMFDYLEQYAAIRQEILQAIESVLESGSLVLGPRVAEFEQAFARYLRPEGYGLGVASGTDALAIALVALEIGPGDEVITVSNTSIATVAAIRMAGATPVFCEIERETLLMDVADAERRVTGRTKAVLPVHLFGSAVDMPRVMELAARQKLAVVEDCAQACGTKVAGQMTGTFGDVGCFSFYPTKNLGAYGDAGLCFTRDPALHERMRQVRQYGWDERRTSQREGINSRLDELQAAVLLVKLAHLDNSLAGRRKVARAYEENLASHIVRPRVPSGVLHSYHLFVVELEDRASVIERLSAEGIGYGIHYRMSVHCMDAYAFCGYGPGSLPITEQAAERILSLPCYPELPHEAVLSVCKVVNDAA